MTLEVLVIPYVLKYVVKSLQFVKFVPVDEAPIQLVADPELIVYEVPFSCADTEPAVPNNATNPKTLSILEILFVK